MLKFTSHNSSKCKLSTVSIILSSLRKNWCIALLMMLFIGVSVCLSIIPPMILEKCVDQMSTGLSISFSLACSYFVLSAIGSLADILREVLITITGQRINHDIRSAMCNKLLLLNADYFIITEPAAICSRFVNDVDQLEALFTNGIVSMVADALKVISILFAVFYRSKGLGLLLVILAPFLLLFTRFVQKRMLRAQYQNRVAVSRTSKLIPETLKNLRMIHVFHAESFMESRYQTTVQDSFAALEKSNFFDAVFSPIITTISALIVGTVMIFSAKGGAYAAFFGMSVGTAVAITAYISKIFTPIESIGMEIQHIQSAIAGVTRIDEFFREKERPLYTADSYKPRKDAPAMAMENVSFSYDGVTDVLQDISFKVSEGESVTLTGRTGAGKSTVFKLLLGLYQPQSGLATLHGIPSSHVPDAIRRNVIGYVEQSFHFVSGTVRDQITLSDPSITDEQVNAAVAISGLTDCISSFEYGLDTPCQESMFSQGERQLLAIARAIVSEPSLLLLDEITANLDSATETRVLEAISKACVDRTVLAISHRVYRSSGSKEIHIGI